jgi:muramoyltetrapeptide carboxypeptidase
MKRKDFISTLLPAVLSVKAISADIDEGKQKQVIPPYLKRGDTIGITSSAGYISLEDIQPALLRIGEWGLKVSIGTTIGKRDFTFGGTDEERLTDLQQMLDDPHIRAIMFARGGYGTVRLVDKLNFKKCLQYPKWLIGFSDITVIHNHISRQYGLASIHSKMCNSFPSDWSLAEPVQIETIDSIRRCLAGEKMSYNAIPNPHNKTGTAKGVLVGGNLKTIESLAGSASDLVTKNKILFVEDTGEYLYSIDRMFWNLKRTGKLASLKGLVVGGFKIKKDDEGEEFGKILEEIVLEKVSGYNYPVCFDFPVGHQKNNYALKCGMWHRLDVSSAITTLQEISQ